MYIFLFLERPHECQLCASKFYTKYRLNRHMTNVHRDGKPKMVLGNSKFKRIDKSDDEDDDDEDEEEEEESHQQENVQQVPIRIVQTEPITFYELI